MKELGTQTGHTDASYTNQAQEKEQIISGIDDMIEEMATSVKEIVKSKNLLVRNTQENEDSMNSLTIIIIGEEIIGIKGNETQVKGIENIFCKIIKFPLPEGNSYQST